MRGAIVGIMAANPTAFRALQRTTPYDGENMNRLFAAPARTSQSHQAAAILMENAWSTADAVMDLHSGGIQEVVPFYALYWADGSPASQESARLARAAGTPHIWKSSDAWLGGAMYTSFTKRGKPALIIECGSGGDLNARDVDNFARAIEGVAKALGILPGRAPAQRRYRYLGACDLVFNQRGGYFLPAAAPGATVAKRQVIGRVMDAHGKLVEEIRAPGRSFIAAIVRENRAIHSGTMVAECCALEA
jgi:predicted deacylase